jgi:uncharacterized protein (DUF486 family)
MQDLTLDYIIYAMGVLIAVVLYTFASFYSTTGKHPPNNIKAWLGVIGTGVLFATIEYIFKIPAYISAHKFLSPAYIHLIWLVLAFFATNIFQIFVTKEEISLEIWIIGALMVIELGFLLYIRKHK